MYQIPQLLKFPDFIHAFSTVDEGNMSFKFGSKQQVVCSRERFLTNIGIDINDAVAMWVEHKDKVVVADWKLAGKSMLDPESALRVDGLITNKKGLYLFLLIADCLPVILFDPRKKVIALVHVGWKNADINSIGAVVGKLKKTYKTNPSNLIVGFGPAARKDSFIKESLGQVNDSKWKDFIERVDADKYKVDFVGLCKKQLIDEGIQDKNIFDCGIDTISDKRFFSYYRDSKTKKGDHGRFACIIGLK